MKRMSMLVAVAMGAMMFCSVAKGQAPSNDVQNVSHFQLARLMVQLCGLTTLLPTDRAVTETDYFQLLAFNNIQPAGGWRSGLLVTRADLARVVVQAMGESKKVENPDNPESWINYLVGKGIKVDTIGLGTKPVDPMAFPLGVDPVVALQNILNDVVKPIPPATPNAPAKGARI
jgi:hypothetical protein